MNTGQIVTFTYFILVKIYFYHISTYPVCEQTQLLDHIFVAISHSSGYHDQDEYGWHHCQCVAVHNKLLGWHNIDHLKQDQQCSVNFAHYHKQGSLNTINILCLLCKITDKQNNYHTDINKRFSYYKGGGAHVTCYIIKTFVK